MTTKTVGKLDSWDDGDIGGSDFMQLEEGSNPVRMVTSPYQFYIHWTKDATGANRKIRCATKDCPLCQQGEQYSARWYVAAINRKTNRPVILEIGPQIFKQIAALSRKDKWGDPKKYDVDITRQPKGSQPLYIVSPEPHSVLTDGEKSELKEFMARVDLAKMTAPPTPAEVREKVGLSDSNSNSNSDSVSSDFDEPTPDSSEDDFNFDG
jgi:hypothetical protein